MYHLQLLLLLYSKMVTSSILYQLLEFRSDERIDPTPWYYVASNAEHLILTERTTPKGNTKIYLSNRNIHSTLENVTQVNSSGYSTPKLMLSKSGGMMQTFIHNDVNTKIYYLMYLKVPEFVEHRTEQPIRNSIHDLSLIKETRSYPALAFSTPFVNAIYDSVYFIHLPTVSMSTLSKQYLIIATKGHKPEGTKATVHLPEKQVSLQQLKVSIQSRVLDKLKVVFSSNLKTVRTYGESVNVTLGIQGHPYELIECEEGDLTGTKIESEDEISLVAGIDFVKPPLPAWVSDYDIIEDQLLPEATSATLYIIPLPTLPPALAKTYSGFHITMSVMAGERLTKVYLCLNSVPTTLLARQSIEKAVTEPGGCVVRSNYPVSVIAYFSLVISPENKLYMGSAMSSVLPRSLWSNSYTFHTDSNSEQTYYVILVVDERDIQSLLLNEVILDLVWMAVSGSDFMTSMITLPPGEAYRLRMRTPNVVFAAYLMSTNNHSLALTPAYIRRPATATQEKEQAVMENCINTVSYAPDKFAMLDYLDNDCDGLVDEELCVGDYLNIDDDGDGQVDEDCSGWAHTSYLDLCLTDRDCSQYGQVFQCVDGECVCPQTSATVKGSSGWFYDQIDGLCWPARGYDVIGGFPHGRDWEECGASFYLRYLYNGHDSCLCTNHMNPWENNMTCYGRIGDTFCSRYRHLCEPWEECISSDQEYFCVEMAQCYGDKSIPCNKGLTCLLSKGKPFCQDITDDCVQQFGNTVCPPHTNCIDGEGTFTCGPFVHPCDNKDLKDSICLRGYKCIPLEGASYHCIVDEDSIYLPGLEKPTCDPNNCLEDHVCVVEYNGYQCIDYVPCTLSGIADDDCTDTQTCLAVNHGHVCITSEALVLYGERLTAEEEKNTRTMLGFSLFVLAIPLIIIMVRVHRNSSHQNQLSSASGDWNVGQDNTLLKAEKEGVARRLGSNTHMYHPNSATTSATEVTLSLKDFKTLSQISKASSSRVSFATPDSKSWSPRQSRQKSKQRSGRLRTRKSVGDEESVKRQSRKSGKKQSSTKKITKEIKDRKRGSRKKSQNESLDTSKLPMTISHQSRSKDTARVTSVSRTRSLRRSDVSTERSLKSARSSKEKSVYKSAHSRERSVDNKSTKSFTNSSALSGEANLLRKKKQTAKSQSPSAPKKTSIKVKRSKSVPKKTFTPKIRSSAEKHPTAKLPTKSPTQQQAKLIS